MQEKTVGGKLSSVANRLFTGLDQCRRIRRTLPADRPIRAAPVEARRRLHIIRNCLRTKTRRYSHVFRDSIRRKMNHARVGNGSATSVGLIELGPLTKVKIASNRR